MKRQLIAGLTFLVLLMLQSIQALGQNTVTQPSQQKQMSFVEILSVLTGQNPFVVSDIPLINELNQARTSQQAEQIAQKIKYSMIYELDKNRLDRHDDMTGIFSLMDEAAVDQLATAKPMTFVIVPGLLGEFIDTRAFEEVFARSSVEKTNWLNNKKADEILDPQYQLNRLGFINQPLRKLVDVASIDDANGSPILKLVILRTHIGTLESVGHNVDRADIFNRRLEKYLSIDPAESMVFIGYSRGTPLGLEMIVQADKKKLSYLPKLKAMISYAGVVMGSALADVTDDESTESGRLFKAAKKLQASLKTANTTWEKPLRFAQNSAAVAEFTAQLTLNSEFNPDSFLKSAKSGDFKTIAVLIAKVSAELGFKSVTDFNGHVIRLQTFITEILKSVDGLKSKNIENWWKINTLPRHIQYLSLTAAMVDPDKSVLEKQIFQAKHGYNDTLDDDSLQANRRTYEKITGVALNDSQVAIHQSLFLPNLIGSLNVNNQGLKMQALGLLQTHHWGVSLQTVNVMKDGTLNPFPREQVLIALKSYLSQFETNQ